MLTDLLRVSAAASGWYSCVTLWPGVLENSVPAAQLGLASGDAGEWPQGPSVLPQKGQGVHRTAGHPGDSLVTTRTVWSASPTAQRFPGMLPHWGDAAALGGKQEWICGGRGAWEPGLGGCGEGRTEIRKRAASPKRPTGTSEGTPAMFHRGEDPSRRQPVCSPRGPAVRAGPHCVLTPIWAP